jgi:hypothetical protein
MVSKSHHGIQPVSYSGPIQVAQSGTLVDAECSVSYLASTGAFASPAARIASALTIARAVTWVAVKVLFVVIAVPLIVLFAVASFGAMFARGAW